MYPLNLDTQPVFKDGECAIIDLKWAQLLIASVVPT